MREINQLIYNTIKNNSSYRTYAGASVSDPRVYKQRTPAKIEVSQSKPAYIVYRFAGAMKPPDWIHGTQRNNLVYSLETYSKLDTRLTEIADLIETLFEDKAFQTLSYGVGYTYATRGSEMWDEGRSLYFMNISLYFENIYTLPELVS